MKWIDKLKSIFIPNLDQKTTIQTESPNKLSISLDDFETIISNTYTPEQHSHKTSNTLQLIQSMLQKEFESTSGTIIDARRLSKIFSDYSDAIRIITASILSPNNFLQLDINFRIKSDIFTDKEKAAIIDYISSFFNKQFKLPEKLKSWILASLEYSGSKPILILPYSAITKLRSTGILNISTESLNSNTDSIIEQIANRKIYTQLNYNSKLHPSQEQLDIELGDDDIIEIQSSLESLADVINESSKKQKTITTVNGRKTIVINTDNNVIIDSLKKYFKSKNINSQIAFVEDPTLTIVNGVIKQKNKKTLESKLEEALTGSDVTNIQYRREPFLDLSPYLVDEDEEEQPPLIVELPPESVIPISTPGSPQSHLGYFVLLSSTGEPLSSHLIEDDEQLLRSIKTEDPLIRDLYKVTYGKHVNIYDTLTKNAKEVYLKTIKKIYNAYIQSIMKGNLKQLGISEVDFQLSNSILNTLLSRILAHKKTYVVYVPESILVYFALEYDEHGRGIPKSENIKFIASLRMTYIITALFAMINNSINTKRISIDFDENIPNPLSLAKDIREELIRNRMFNFSYEPSQILKTLLEREISVVPSNLPGVNNFNISEEAVQRSINTPDSDLKEELTNMFISGLNVPPSFFNQLRESEFSRTVATNNLIFTLLIMELQKLTLQHVNKLIRLVLKYHPKLKSQIQESILTFTNEENKDKIDEKWKLLLETITMILPSPKISMDKAMSEEIRSFTDVVDQLTDKLFPDGIVPDDLRDEYDRMKNLFSKTLLEYFLDQTNAMAEFDIEKAKETDPLKVVDLIKHLQNHKKLYEDLMKTYESESGGGY